MNSNTSVTPYIFFNGRCAEAIEFYCKTIGAEPLMQMKYSDAPPEVKAQQKQQGCGDMDGKIMHARLKINNSTVMLSDGPCWGKYDGFALTLAAATPADAEGYFKALSAEGKVEMPLNKTFFSPAFGMLTDRFGVKWMVIVETAR